MDSETVLSLLGRPSDAWRLQAACLGADISLFIQEGITSDTYEARRAALRICASCRVRQQCLDFAMQWTYQSIVGIWGGTTQRQRQRLQAKNPRLTKWSPVTECPRGHVRRSDNEIEASSKGEIVCSECNREDLSQENRVA